MEKCINNKGPKMLGQINIHVKVCDTIILKNITLCLYQTPETFVTLHKGRS